MTSAAHVVARPGTGSPVLLSPGLPVRRVRLLVVLLVVAAGGQEQQRHCQDQRQEMRSARRGSVRGVLLLLGGLGYVTYQYGYAFAYGWNRLFPVCVVLLALSGFTLAELLTRLDLHAVARSVDGRVPVVGVARVLLGLGLGLGCSS